MARTKGAKGKKKKLTKKDYKKLDKLVVDEKWQETPVTKKIIDDLKEEVDLIGHIEGKFIEELPPTVTKEQKERKEKLNSVLRDLCKSIGGDSVKFAKDVDVRGRVPFGQKSITEFTGGGIPYGTFTTFWGAKGCAKTTVILDLIAAAQKDGKQCVYINGERSYDPVYATKRGVNTNSLVVIDAEELEQGLDAIIKLCREKVVDLIVLDSIHGLAPKAELYKGKAEKEKSTSDANMALRARALTQFFEMGTAVVANAKCAVLFVAQSRTNLSGFIKLEHLTGGNALMHASRLILRFKRGQKADAPTEKRPTGAVTVKGKPAMESIQVGFDLKIRADKSQIDGCVELSEIHLPFYFLGGIKE